MCQICNVVPTFWPRRHHLRSITVPMMENISFSIMSVYQGGIVGYIRFMFWAKPGFPPNNLVIFNNLLFYRFLSL